MNFPPADTKFVVLLGIAAGVFASICLLSTLNVIGAPNWLSMWPLIIPGTILIGVSIHWTRSDQRRFVPLLWAVTGSAFVVATGVLFFMIGISV